MATPFNEKSFRTREQEVFREANSELTKKAVTVEQDKDDPIPVKTRELIQGEDYDLITASYPDALTEVFTYSLAGDDVLKTTVTYTDSSKRDISTVVFE